jgi:cobalt-zinc-cadmium efflux system membrane fusion protein
MHFKTFTCVVWSILLCVSLYSCQDTVKETQLSAFQLSDAMMERCTFHPVSIQQVKNEIRLFGKITADNNKLAQVYPVVGGVVKSIEVELGDFVKQGQVLATLQSSEVASFRKEKLDAENDVAIAEKNLQVAKDLFSGKLTSEKDVAVAERELEKAKAELTRMQEIYSIYNLKSGSVYQVIAPISGYVVSKNINQNEQMRSDISDPLFSIADIDEVWALANVSESNVSKIKVGQEAEIKTLSFPDKPFNGKIDKIFNAIDPETKAMKVRVKIPNTDNTLKPEMNCTVSVRFTEEKECLTIPSSALIFDKSKYWVMVFKDRHQIETRKVEIYRQTGNLTYILSGVEEGEQVISSNAILVYDALND